MNQVSVELHGLATDPRTNGVVILLASTESDSMLPVHIDPVESQVIAASIPDKSSRPMTHDLMGKFIDEAGAEVKEVSIGKDKKGYVGHIYMNYNNEDEMLTARPADAIALALNIGANILVDKEIMDEVAQSMPKNMKKNKISKKNQYSTERAERVAKLEEKLEQAIEKENYEKAATLRDKINNLKQKGEDDNG